MLWWVGGLPEVAVAVALQPGWERGNSSATGFDSCERSFSKDTLWAAAWGGSGAQPFVRPLDLTRPLLRRRAPGSLLWCLFGVGPRSGWCVLRELKPNITVE